MLGADRVRRLAVTSPFKSQRPASAKRRLKRAGIRVKQVVLRGVGSVSALFTGSKTIHRPGEHLANRTQKPGLPHPHPALATENLVFFPKGGSARYAYGAFH